jgi:hypothetical protein
VGLARPALGSLFLVGALALAGCGGGGSTTTVASTATASHPYPASLETHYMSNCQRTAQAASHSSRDFSSACRCALDYIEAHENVREFISDTAGFARSLRYPPIWRQAVLSCRDRIPAA